MRLITLLLNNVLRRDRVQDVSYKEILALPHLLLHASHCILSIESTVMRLTWMLQHPFFFYQTSCIIKLQHPALLRYYSQLSIRFHINNELGMNILYESLDSLICYYNK
jgi:hypothetical protein